jgi:(R)-2-hydroxyacyl-CoA dehydratese activating ATPase
MNDKCAAGTGRFLEIMAMALRYDLDEFAEKAYQHERGRKCKQHVHGIC